MTLKILQDIAKDINNSIFYTIMADEVTDASNHEQFVICLRWVDKFLEAHKDFIGLYKIDNIKADTLRTAIEDVLLRLAIPLQNARVQCYDGANSIVGLRSGLATQILDKSPRAFLIHCFAHALNLSVNYMVRQIPFLDNIMSNSLEISTLSDFHQNKMRCFTSSIKSLQQNILASEAFIQQDGLCGESLCKVF